jgi:NAD(P)H-nitrite reductase large subunit
MQKINYLIIGGGIAGTTAAETIRQNDKKSSIAIISDEPHPLYSRIMLSKPDFVSGKIPFEKIWLKNIDWYKENKIDLFTTKKAIKLDSLKKVVYLNDNTELQYGKLLLAIGGCARKLDIPGIDKEGVFTLRTLDDFKAMTARLKSAKHAVAIGGGATNFEACEFFRKLGLETILVIREPHFWDPVLDETSGRIIEKALKKNGVKIIRNVYAKEIIGANAIEGVIFDNKMKISCEIIILGVGIFCPFEWLKTAGIETNRGIIVNEYLETNQPDIWVAGDAAEFYHPILEDRLQLGSWVGGQLQGKIAGLNMIGQKEVFGWIPFYTMHGFDVNIAFAGDIRLLPDRIAIPRGISDSYGRIIIKGNRIVGATLINRGQELQPILKLIENKTDISQKQKELSDQNFDLKNL